MFVKWFVFGRRLCLCPPSHPAAAAVLEEIAALPIFIRLCTIRDAAICGPDLPGPARDKFCELRGRPIEWWVVH